MAKHTIANLLTMVIKTQEAMCAETEGQEVGIRNPVKVRTKGRPKTGQKRYKSQAEKSRKRQK